MNIIKSLLVPFLTLITVANAQAPTSQNLQILEAPKIVQDEYIVPISHNALYVKSVDFSLQSQIDRLSHKYNVDPNLASKIIRCESSNIAHATGTLAKVGIDVGYWQINTYYHLETARKMGLDIYNPVDNLEYGAWLMSKHGTQPWSASEHCWSVL